MRFQGRAHNPGTILGKDIPRDAFFGIPSGSHKSCTRPSMNSDHSLPPQKIEPGGSTPWTPARGKDVTIHGVSVRAKRMPPL